MEHITRHDNEILAGLPGCEWNRLADAAERVAFVAGTVLSRPGDLGTSVYFPTAGIVSVVNAFETGQCMEVAPVGADGFVGIGIVLQMQPSPYWYVVHLDSTGYSIPAPAFERAFHAGGALHRLVMAYAGKVVIDAERAVMCHRFHSHHQRLATWLLVVAERARQTSLHLTHDSIAQLVGGPRHAVTSSLAIMRQHGAIDYSRGHIHIVDVQRLRALACECASQKSRADFSDSRFEPRPSPLPGSQSLPRGLPALPRR